MSQSIGFSRLSNAEFTCFQVKIEGMILGEDRQIYVNLKRIPNHLIKWLSLGDHKH